MKTPEINYTVNSANITIGEIDLYFSYKTIIAFRTPKTGLVVCENVWSNTTGKHINAIDGGNKKSRLPRAEFLKIFETL